MTETPLPSGWQRRESFFFAQLLTVILALSLVTTLDSSQTVRLLREGDVKNKLHRQVHVNSANNKRVLLTGGAGFIGSHTAGALLARGDTVIIVDSLNDAYSVQKKLDNLQIVRSHPNASLLQTLFIYKGDINNSTFLQQVFETTNPDHICHLAARAGVRPSVEAPLTYVESNIAGTTNLLEIASKSQNPPIVNFVYASSSSVYGGLGHHNKAAFREDLPLDQPWSQYAATKKSTELMAATYHHLYNLSTTGLRFFTVYGPRGRPDMAPYKFIDQISQGRPIQQFGDGTDVRDFTYVDDIVDGILRSIDRPFTTSPQVFNLGRGDGITLKRFIGLVEQYTGKQAKKEILPLQTGDVPFTLADTTKAYSLLGYKPKIEFEEGICRTVAWYNATYMSQHGTSPVGFLKEKVAPTRL